MTRRTLNYRREIRRKALCAAAAVVLAAGTSACVQKVDAATPPLDEDSDVLSVADDETDLVVSDSDVTADSDDADDSDVAEETDLVSVDTDVDTDTDDPLNAEPVCVDVAPELFNECCEARWTWCASQFGDGTEDFNTCQFGPDFSGETGCIPWGPPAPPAMSLA